MSTRVTIRVGGCPHWRQIWVRGRSHWRQIRVRGRSHWRQIRVRGRSHWRQIRVRGRSHWRQIRVRGRSHWRQIRVRGRSHWRQIRVRGRSHWRQIRVRGRSHWRQIRVRGRSHWRQIRVESGLEPSYIRVNGALKKHVDVSVFLPFILRPSLYSCSLYVKQLPLKPIQYIMFISVIDTGHTKLPHSLPTPSLHTHTHHTLSLTALGSVIDVLLPLTSATWYHAQWRPLKELEVTYHY